MYGIEKPQYEHDCDNCTFVIRQVLSTEDATKNVDIYVCVKTHTYPSGKVVTDLNHVIRCSSAPGDYTSWTDYGVSVANSDVPMQEVPVFIEDNATIVNDDPLFFEKVATWERELCFSTYRLEDLVRQGANKTDEYPVSGDMLTKYRKGEL